MKRRVLHLLWLAIALLLAATRALASDNVTLSIYAKGAAGEFDNSILQERYPYILWEKLESERFESVTALAQALVSNSAADIYAVNYAFSNYNDIVKKGYAEPLNDNTDLVNAVDQMHQFIQKAVFENDTLFALPISLSCSHWAYSLKGFETIGFTVKDVPNDYISLLTFIDWWVEEGSYDYPDTTLLRGTQDTRRAIIERIVQDLIDYCWYSDQPITFNTPELQAIFEQLDLIDTTKEDVRLSALTEGDAYQRRVLFDINYDWFNIEASEENDSFVPLPIAVISNQTWIIPVDMRVFIVNPNSAHIEEAMLYLSTYIEGIDVLFNKIVNQNAGEPLINPYAVEPLRQAEAEVKRLETLLTTAAESEVRTLEDELLNARNNAERLSMIQWRVTNENLLQYQATVPYYYVRKYSPIGFLQSEDYTNMGRLVAQYAQRQISAEAFLAEMDRLIQYVMKEAGE